MRTPEPSEQQDPTGFMAVTSPTKRAADPDAPTSTHPNIHTTKPVVRAHSIVLGLVATALNSLWIVHMERVRQGPYPTTVSLFLNCIFTLLIIQGVNALAWKALPRWALRQPELLTIYSMSALGTALAGLDSLTIVPQVAADPFYMATKTNQWASLLWPHIPKWLTVQDHAALRDYYIGNSRLYTLAHLRAWVPPLAAWGLFVMLLLWVMLCLNVLVRRQWQDHERLSYPLIQLPIEMTRPGAPLYHQPGFLLGAGLVAALDLLNGFAQWYPNVPAMHVWGVDIAKMLPARPWDALWWMPVNYFPFVVGMGFLLPIDLLFSCWFFYLFWKGERVVFSAGGWGTSSNFPYINEQCFGAYVAIVAFSLWAGRQTYGEIYRKAIGKPSMLDDSEEALSYRAAFFGALAGTLALILLCVEAGLSLWVAVLFFAVYWILMIAIARIRAELGPPVHDLHFTGPDFMIPTAFGTRNLSGDSLAVLSLFFWFNRAYRSCPMPVETEALAMAQRVRAEQRRTMVALMLAGVVGTVATFWGCLHFAYILGTQAKMPGGSGMGTEGFNRLQNWINNPSGPGWGNIAAMGVGFLASLALMIAHTRIPGWPFHAMGFAISGSWSMNLMWFPLFLAWLFKLFSIRYGGIKGYRLMMTFFLGLIVGEAAVGIGWAFFQVFVNVPIYNYFGS